MSTPRILTVTTGCWLLSQHPALHDKANDQGVVVNSLAD